MTCFIKASYSDELIYGSNKSSLSRALLKEVIAIIAMKVFMNLFKSLVLIQHLPDHKDDQIDDLIFYYKLKGFHQVISLLMLKGAGVKPVRAMV